MFLLVRSSVDHRDVGIGGVVRVLTMFLSSFSFTEQRHTIGCQSSVTASDIKTPKTDSASPVNTRLRRRKCFLNTVNLYKIAGPRLIKGLSIVMRLNVCPAVNCMWLFSQLLLSH